MLEQDQSIEFVDRPVLEKLHIFCILKIFPRLSSQNMHGALENVYNVVGHVTILSFRGLC